MRTSILSLFPLKHHYKVVSIAISIAVLAIALDTSIIKIYYSSINQPLYGEKVDLFVIISIIVMITQYIALEFAGRKDGDSEQIHNLNILNRVAALVQYAIVAILLFVILQMYLTSSYIVSTLVVATALSYAIAAVIMALLAQRFLSWYRSNRNLLVLLYGLSSVAISFNVIFGIISVALPLQNQPSLMKERTGLVTPIPAPNPFLPYINYTYVVSSIVSFALTWAATAFLLRHHFQGLNPSVYWFIISIPLVYFLIQFQPLFLTFFSEFSGTELVLFSVISTLILSWSKLIGGVLFGVAFFVIARKVIHKDILRKYAVISAYGYMLLFASNQAIVLSSAPYPPFGLATISFVGLSSYLALVGIYSSAISVSQEINLRKTIRKSILKDSNLLNSIGFAEGEKEFLRKIVGIAKEQIDKMSEETGVRFLKEEDTKQYLDEVLKEIKDKKSRDESS